ncbi:phosphotransferase [Cupriavidus sp. IK-TO18]|uniref:phosphotransferase n=1 Tax=Cupriavidus sp. IK-TO18 TaxID=2782182 RepID=UPI0018978A4D|nr:phosphotransferase [Cupriavidus sp. IK-TO18]MBF6992518.1 phosphotransferase [Cupriavidus sp. IK-TO18]
MTNDNAVGDIFTQAISPVPLESVDSLVRELYGIQPDGLARLTGERDQNFRITARDGRRYVLKVTHPSEPRAVTEMQTMVFRHIAQVDPNLPVQALVPSQTAGDSSLQKIDSHNTAVVRLFTYLEGTPLHTQAPDARHRESIGTIHARLDRALRGLDHPAADHELLWDLKQMGKMRPLLGHIASAQDRRLAEMFLDDYDRHAARGVQSLRQQLIHNDLNPYNILVDPHSGSVTGILDFGDVVKAPLLNDVAIAASYFVPAGGAHPLAWAAEYVAAYHAVTPLEPNEVDLLFPLITARLVMTVAITGWRAALHPENSTYILRNNGRAWDGLRQLSGITFQEGQEFFRSACLLPTPQAN